MVGLILPFFFFHCRFGGKKEERWSFDIFGESFVFAAFFFHCGEIFSSSGEIIFCRFFILDTYGKRAIEFDCFF